MTTLQTLLLVAHVFIGFVIVVLVLMQRGKGAEAGAAFGAGASATVFGAKGSANFMSRATAVMATLFFVTSLGLAYLGGERPVVQSVIEQGAGDSQPEPPATAPATVPPAAPVEPPAN
jgi:preprotein translocase subunit SecG